MSPHTESALTRLRDAFVAQLPTRLAVLERWLAQAARGEAGAAARLRQAAHSLVGAAGVHRLPNVIAAASRLESLAADLPPAGTIDPSTLFALHKALARLETEVGDPAAGIIPRSPYPLGRIILIEGGHDETPRLREMLGDAGFLVETCTGLADCDAASTRSARPAAAIAAFPHPGAEPEPGLTDQVDALRRRGVPVIFLAPRHDLHARLAAHRAGAAHCLTTPVERDALMQVLAAEAASARPCRVLVVDDDPGQLADAIAILEDAGMEVRGTVDPFEVPALLEDFAAESLVLDVDMPQCSGPELAVILRDDAQHRMLPILYLAPEGDAAASFFPIDQGGEFCLPKPVDPAHLAAVVAHHARRHREAREQLEALRAALYERERQQHALDAHAIVSITDTAGTILYANDRFCEVSGYARHELLGQNHRIIKSGLHPDEFYAEMWRTLTRGAIWHGEICNRRKDGSLYWVESSIVPFLDASGTPYQYISIRTDITRVKQAEQRLARSQAYANIGTWDWNIATGGLYWSERIASLFGLPEGALETTYANFLAAVHPDDREKVVGAINACMELGAEYHIEHRVVWPDGSVRWVVERGDVVRDATGAPLHMLGVVQDITERKLAEVALEESQRLARLGNWSADLATGNCVWSKEVYALFGRAHHQYVPTLEDYLTHLVHPLDAERVRLAFKLALKNGRSESIDHRIRLPDGTIRWIQADGRIEYDAHGSPAAISGTFQDITARKQTETALEESRKQLEEAQSLAKLGHWSADLTRGTLTWSEEIYRIFGRDPATFTPSVDAFQQAVHPDDLPLVQDAAERAAATGVHEIVHRIVRPDGEVRYVHELARAERDANGNVERLSGSVQDITELKRAEQAMLQAKEAAEAASRAKSEFLASMSHELRTPLNSILGFAQLFGLDRDLPDTTREHAREIERAGQRLLSLVNDLIDLARIEAGKMELFAAPVSLKGVVGDSMAMVAPIARERGIHMIDAGGIGDETQVLADATRLQQVLINLLANAIKYNHRGGTVHLGCRLENGRARVSIADTGPGIPVEKQARMFNPFDRLGAERGQVEGSGIGLVITQRIVEAMGGTIGFESVEGRGSTFWVELALAYAPAPAQVASPAPDTGEMAAIHSYVLYIEDNPMNQRLMQQIFAARKQLELRTAHTAEIGIQLARVEPPALILMDINLPGMDGYEALAALQADPRTADIPVAAVSANAMKGDEKRGLEAGFAAYLTKPLDIPALFRTIDQLTMEGGKR